MVLTLNIIVAYIMCVIDLGDKKSKQTQNHNKKKIRKVVKNRLKIKNLGKKVTKVDYRNKLGVTGVEWHYYI